VTVWFQDGGDFAAVGSAAARQPRVTAMISWPCSTPKIPKLLCRLPRYTTDTRRLRMFEESMNFTITTLPDVRKRVLRR